MRQFQGRKTGYRTRYCKLTFFDNDTIPGIYFWRTTSTEISSVKALPYIQEFPLNLRILIAI
jgi:hypothetical protein